MMMKRLGFAGAACLALALVFAACQNGVQEIEGSVGVGLSKEQLSAPASIAEPIPEATWLAALESGVYDFSSGIPAAFPLPPFVILSWTAGPGFNNFYEEFAVFVKIVGTNSIVALTNTNSFSQGGGDKGLPPQKSLKLTPDEVNSTNTSIDTWYARVDINKMAGDLGLTTSTSLRDLILTNGIQFGVQTVLKPSAPEGRVPSGIQWTGPLGLFNN